VCLCARACVCVYIYIYIKHNRFGIQACNVCGGNGHAQHDSLLRRTTFECCFKYQNCSAANEEGERRWHALFKDNNFSSSELFCDLHNRKINICGNSRHNRHSMPTNSGKNTLLLKEGDNDCNVQGDTSVVCWKGKRRKFTSSPKFITLQHRVVLWTKQRHHRNRSVLRVTTTRV
jgi:hypothetical protein